MGAKLVVVPMQMIVLTAAEKESLLLSLLQS